jgi:hypothetical protein
VELSHRSSFLLEGWCRRAIAVADLPIKQTGSSPTPSLSSHNRHPFGKQFTPRSVRETKTREGVTERSSRQKLMKLDGAVAIVLGPREKRQR